MDSREPAVAGGVLYGGAPWLGALSLPEFIDNAILSTV
jgi:hypothetical protein